MKQKEISVQTLGRSFHNITREINIIVNSTEIVTGLCHIFNTHTSASLLLSENSDPNVCEDLEAFMQRIAPDDIKLYKHNSEGPDDMPAHIRTVLTHADLTIPISQSKLNLGTWQGIFLWEHRYHATTRHLIITCYG